MDLRRVLILIVYEILRKHTSNSINKLREREKKKKIWNRLGIYKVDVDV